MTTQELIFRNDFDVQIVNAMGGDIDICRAARVSTLGSNAWDSDESAGLINFLMRNRHGTPFEHGAITYRISAPIFVWREFMRHRIGFSYNEESGRYKELAPVFYIPSRFRELIQVGKVGEYSFEPGNQDQYTTVRTQLQKAYVEAWWSYQTMLEDGIAKEVARMCLPVSIYSSAYVTCNPRSLMAFLSLRTKRDGTTYPSKPMKEINQVANQMEELAVPIWPLTFQAFNMNGRVGP